MIATSIKGPMKRANIKFKVNKLFYSYIQFQNNNGNVLALLSHLQPLTNII